MGLAVGLILLLVAAALIFLNIDSMVQLNLAFTELNVPLWAIMVGFLVVGLIAAWLMALTKDKKNKEKLNEKDEKLRDQDDKIRIADKTKEEAVNQTRQETQSDVIKKNAEIEGLKKQIASLEQEVNTHMSNSTSEISSSSNNTESKEIPISKTEKLSKQVQVEPKNK